MIGQKNKERIPDYKVKQMEHKYVGQPHSHKPLWQASPSRQLQSQIYKFMQQKGFSSYQELYKYSLQIEGKNNFWTDLLHFYPFIYEGDPSITSGPKSFFEYNWFPDLKLNFAENLLSQGQDNHIALTYEHESGLSKELSYEHLRLAVKGFQDHIQDTVQAGDVVAAYMPNIPETVIAMLGTTSLGGVFTSISCDFGSQSVLSRFAQTKPKVLVVASAYEYNGKRYMLTKNIQEIIAGLTHLKKVVVVDFLKTGIVSQRKDISIKSVKIDIWDEIVSENTEAKQKQDTLKFKRVPFKSPLYIMYSSGTTGKPKCIVHSVGGTLLQHIKELGLHCDVDRDKTLFYFTTCAWMMWNWLVSGLFFGGKICLFEGSPKYPSLQHFVDLINRKGISIFGVSPAFLQALKESGYNKQLKLPTLETILSTGSPLSEDLFEFVYSHVKSDMMLSSIAGGTDIISCFMLGNPILPVYSGDITCRGLGMDVAVFDEQGQSVVNKQGELVCRSSFPSQPILDIFEGDRQNYQDAYFYKYSNVWCHGDQARLSSQGTICLFGRSDAILNPGGIRIGTSEIYDVLDQIEGIEDSLCVGKAFGNDTKILLFVKCRHPLCLDENLKHQIRGQIKEHLTTRHLPYMMFQVDDIPYTRNGKKMEVLIRKLLDSDKDQELDESHLGAVRNPECLSQYKHIFP